MFWGLGVTPAKIMCEGGSPPINRVITPDNRTSHRFAKPFWAQNIKNIRNLPLESTTYAIPADRTFKNI